MAHEGIFATSDECIKKAGTGYNSTDITESVINDFCAQAEAEINCLARFNFSDNYASLNSDVKRILSEAASNLVGIYMICYDMSGYNSRIEAEDQINVLRDGYLRCISILKRKEVQTFMENA